MTAYSGFIAELAAKVKKGRDVFIAPNATVIGDVSLGDNVSVWFGAVLRADCDKIVIGNNSNVQDNCVLHVDPDTPIHVGHDTIIGHAAILHGCTVGNHTLIGMRATVLNRARVGDFCIIGAHALVTEGMVIPDYSVVMGSPAKVVKTLTPEQREKVIRNAEAYVELGARYLEGEE